MKEFKEAGSKVLPARMPFHLAHIAVAPIFTAYNQEGLDFCISKVKTSSGHPKRVNTLQI